MIKHQRLQSCDFWNNKACSYKYAGVEQRKLCNVTGSESASNQFFFFLMLWSPTYYLFCSDQDRSNFNKFYTHY